MWILLSVVDGLFLAPYYIVTKRLLTKHGEWGLLVATIGLVSSPCLLSLMFVDNRYKAWTLFGGWVYGLAMTVFLSGYVYVSAFTASVMAQLIPAIAVFFSWRFLGESLNSQQIIAFFVILSGSLMVALNENNKRTAWRGVCALCVSSTMTALYNVVVKYAKNNGVGGFELFVFSRAGVVLAVATLVLIPVVRKRVFKFDALPSEEKAKFGFNELCFISFVIIFMSAVAVQPKTTNVGLISLIYFFISQTGVFVHTLLSGEEKHMMRKLAGASIAFAGLMLLAMR